MSKTKNHLTLVNFKMSRALVDRMKLYCKRHGTDTSKFIRSLIENALLTPDERVQPLKQIEAEFNKSLRELQTKMEAVSGTLHVHELGESGNPLWVEAKPSKDSKRK